jgi:hypothetical protein
MKLILSHTERLHAFPNSFHAHAVFQQLNTFGVAFSYVAATYILVLCHRPHSSSKCLTSITLNKHLRSVLSSSSSSIGTTPLSWVSACSTVVEHSQQEGFTECRCQRHVKPPTWRRTRDLERSNIRHKRPPASEATLKNPAAEGGTMGEKWPRNYAESGDFHVTFGFFYMP